MVIWCMFHMDLFIYLFINGVGILSSFVHTKIQLTVFFFFFFLHGLVHVYVVCMQIQLFV